MRRNIPSMVAGVALVLLLLVYAITYQVRFTEIAIKTTFGKPTDPNIADPTEAGLKFKWPWPIQGIVKYDKRIQMLDSPEEQVQTQDRQILILTVYCGWRIADGVAFLQKVETVREAQDRLRGHLRSEIGAVVGQREFSEFVSTNPAELKLGEIEGSIKQGVAERARPYGIVIETLGIRRIVLPETTTDKVFSQMRAQRTAMADKTRSEGEAIARRIRSQAESLKQQILSFASLKAEQIRAEGKAAAAKEYEVFSRDEDFATFLRKLDLLEKALKTRTTFFLDEEIPGFEMFKQDRPTLGGEPRIAAPKVPKPPSKKGTNKETSGSSESAKRLRDAALRESKK